MANKNIFGSVKTTPPPPDTTNAAGGRAYARPSLEALAQFAVTGCFNGTYYATGKSQLETIAALAAHVDSTSLLKLALYAREEGHMKDMPAFLLALVTARKEGSITGHLIARNFSRIITDVKMLRNYVQIIRSGAVGRKSFGSAPKRWINNWLNSKTPSQLYRMQVGNDPSLGDIIKMTHPKPPTPEHQVVYRYLIGKTLSSEGVRLLPEEHRQLQLFRSVPGSEVPKVPWELLTSTQLNTSQWEQLAYNMTWTQARMNLNTLKRHGALDSPGVVTHLANLLGNPAHVEANKVMPYQLFAAYQASAGELPYQLTDALQDAAELATKNVPDFGGKKVAVLVDVSGSMTSPATGYRGRGTSKMSCTDVASLFASCIIRQNPDNILALFHTQARQVRLNHRDSLMTNAQKLRAAATGGGTDVGSGLYLLNQIKADAGVVVIISDNESWFDGRNRGIYGGTSTMEQWLAYSRRVPNAKLICLDIQPSDTTQVKTSKNILNVGGFSDAVFTVINQWVNGSVENWVDKILQVRVS